MLRRFRLTAVLAALLLIVAACGSSGFPEDYDDQPNAEGVSNVEQNWNETCSVRAELLNADNANEVCRCSYERIKAEIPFEDFKAADDRLRSDPGALIELAEQNGSAEQRISTIVAECIASS